jgi:hypothetical protein
MYLQEEAATARETVYSDSDGNKEEGALDDEENEEVSNR